MKGSARWFTALFFAAAAVALVDGSITGFHVDDETCSGLVADNKTAQLFVCAKFFAMLQNLSDTVAAENRAHRPPSAAPLELTVDVGMGWHCGPGVGGCFNISYKGANKSVGDHIIDLADKVVLMDYRTDVGTVVAAAAPFLRYADSLPPRPAASGGGPATTVLVGLAILGAQSGPREWWQCADEDELAAVMAAATPALSKHPSFGGFAVYFSSTWKTAKPATRPGTRWPRNTGTWYIDHGMALDPAAWPAWLDWAQSRGVGAVYVAPHATASPLISISGVSGSAAHDRVFCEFIHQAEARGISVDLFSGFPAIVDDLRFIRNCSNSLLPLAQSNRSRAGAAGLMMAAPDPLII
jgi:hypothetical protein